MQTVNNQMNSNPFFSVVTSTYNAIKYLPEAVNSVLDQTYKDFEYIIVNNGSTDETKEYLDNLVKLYPDKIRVINVEINQGISGGRNIGIENTKGQYICFLDADDFWLRDKLLEAYTIIKANKNEKITTFCHWEKTVLDNGDEVSAEYRDIDNNNPYEDLIFNGNCLSTSAMIIKSEAIKKINGFNRSLHSGEEDYDCWLRLAENGEQFLMIHKILGAWRKRTDSVSAKTIQHTNAVIAMLNLHVDRLINLNSSYKRKWFKIKSRIMAGAARELSLGGDYDNAKKMYFDAINVNAFNYKAYIGLVLNTLHIGRIGGH